MTDISRKLDKRQSQRIHNIEAGQYKWFFGWLVVGVAIVLLSFLTDRTIAILALPVFLFAGLGAWRYPQGPGYYILGLVRRSREIRKNGSLTPNEDARRRRRRRKARDAPINTTLMEYPVKEPLACLWNPSRDSDTSLTMFKGWDGVSLDPEGRYFAENAFSEAILDAINRNRNSVGVSLIMTIRPKNILPSRGFRDTRMLPAIKDAGARTYDDGPPPTNRYERLAKQAIDLDQRAVLYDRDVTSFVALNVPRPKKWPKSPDGSLSVVKEDGTREGLLTQNELDHAPVVTMTERVVRNLNGLGIKQVEPLGMDGLRTACRMAWDLNMENWYAKLDSDDPIYDEMTNEHFWPWPDDEILVGIDKDGLPYLDCGGTLLRIYKVFRRDGRKVYPGQYASLYSSGDIGLAYNTGLTVTLTGDTFPMQRELASLEKFIRLERGLNSKFNNPNRYVSQQERDEYYALEQRQTMLYQSGSDGLYWNTLIATAATTLEDLSTVDRAVETHSTRLGLQIKKVPFEALQVPALVSATLGMCMM